MAGPENRQFKRYFFICGLENCPTEFYFYEADPTKY